MEEQNNKKKNIIIFVLAVATIIIYVGIFLFIDKEEEEAKKLSADPVTNYSEFYTVSDCANKYINYLVSKNSTSLMNILSAEYIRKNSITEENVLSNLPIVANGSVFSSKKMYMEKLDENNYKYYISGYLETGGLFMDEISRTQSYLIVYLDKKNNLFAIEPYDGKEYIEGAFK